MFSTLLYANLNGYFLTWSLVGGMTETRNYILYRLLPFHNLLKLVVLLLLLLEGIFRKLAPLLLRWFGGIEGNTVVYCPFVTAFKFFKSCNIGKTTSLIRASWWLELFCQSKDYYFNAIWRECFSTSCLKGSSIRDDMTDEFF